MKHPVFFFGLNYPYTHECCETEARWHEFLIQTDLRKKLLQYCHKSWNTLYSFLVSTTHTPMNTVKQKHVDMIFDSNWPKEETPAVLSWIMKHPIFFFSLNYPYTHEYCETEARWHEFLIQTDLRKKHLQYWHESWNTLYSFLVSTTHTPMNTVKQKHVDMNFWLKLT